MSKDSNTKMCIGIFVVIAAVLILWYINSNDDQPIINPQPAYLAERFNGETTAVDVNNLVQPETVQSAVVSQNQNGVPTNGELIQPPVLDNRQPDDMSATIVDELVSQYTEDGEEIDEGTGTFVASDPAESNQGIFDDFVRKRQINRRRTESPFSPDVHDPRDFSYKRNRFTRRTPEDIEDQFNIDAYLPQERRQDWFDTVPLRSTRRIRGTHLAHPKVHMGVNTIGSSLRNGSHDLRGDIPNPKINVSPFLISTIEPDTNIRGLCNPI